MALLLLVSTFEYYEELTGTIVFLSPVVKESGKAGAGRALTAICIHNDQFLTDLASGSAEASI